MNELERSEEKRRENEARKQQRYRELIEKDAGTQPFTEKERAELNAILDASPGMREQAQKDRAVFQRLAVLVPLAQARDGYVRESLTIDKDAAAFKERRESVFKELDAEAGAIAKRKTGVDEQIKKCDGAAQEITQIKQTNYLLLNLEDPAIANGRRHFIQAVAGRPSGTPSTLFELETIMAMPTGWAIPKFDAMELIPPPGESTEKFEARKTLARSLISDGREGRYLCRAADEDRLDRAAHHKGALLAVDAPALDPTTLKKYFLMSLPGEEDKFEGLMNHLKKRLKQMHNSQQLANAGGSPEYASNFRETEERYVDTRVNQ